MHSIKLDDSPFGGRISTPPTNREAVPRDCRHCGSQLAGRYQGVRFIGGEAMRVGACPCGGGHEVRQPVEREAA
jgi:hypothetical protein